MIDVLSLNQNNQNNQNNQDNIGVLFSFWGLSCYNTIIYKKQTKQYTTIMPDLDRWKADKHGFHGV